MRPRLPGPSWELLASGAGEPEAGGGDPQDAAGQREKNMTAKVEVFLINMFLTSLLDF